MKAEENNKVRFAKEFWEAEGKPSMTHAYCAKLLEAYAAQEKPTLNKSEVLSALDGCDHLDDAKMYFTSRDFTEKPTLTDAKIQEWANDRDIFPYYGHCDPEFREGLEIGAKWALNHQPPQKVDERKRIGRMFLEYEKAKARANSLGVSFSLSDYLDYLTKTKEG